MAKSRSDAWLMSLMVCVARCTSCKGVSNVCTEVGTERPAKLGREKAPKAMMAKCRWPKTCCPNHGSCLLRRLARGIYW